MSSAALDIAITGAAGFVGRATVRAALDAGHRVRALLRPGGSSLGIAHPRLDARPVALVPGATLAEALRGADAVIHLAAAMSGDYARYHAGIVGTTQALMPAMREAGVTRLVGVSSFAVYDYRRLADGARLDETAPRLEAAGPGSHYQRTKRLQEDLFEDFGAVVIRPGLIYDRERVWNFALGRPLGARVWLLLGPDAPVPFVHVDDVAQALLAAAARPLPRGTVINLVEPEPPRRRLLVQRLNAALPRPRRILRLPWGLHRLLARAAAAVRRLLGGRPRLPGLLDPLELEVRFKPLRYDAARAQQLLGWRCVHRVIDGG